MSYAEYVRDHKLVVARAPEVVRPHLRLMTEAEWFHDHLIEEVAAELGIENPWTASEEAFERIMDIVYP